MNDPARTPVRRSLLRPLLVLGGERELVFLSGMITAVLVFSLANPIAAGVGIAFWAAALAAFGRMARHDSQLTRVYIRHVNKKLYYPAHAHASAVDSEIKKHQ